MILVLSPYAAIATATVSRVPVFLFTAVLECLLVKYRSNSKLQALLV